MTSSHGLARAPCLPAPLTGTCVLIGVGRFEVSSPAPRHHHSQAIDVVYVDVVVVVLVDNCSC